MKKRLPLLLSITFLLSTFITTGCVQTPRHQHKPSYKHSAPVKHPRRVDSYRHHSMQRSQIINMAYQKIGVRYKYGGNSPRTGFDCSGFTKYIHNETGINIPRTAAQQRDASRTIRYSELQPGDLIFFKTGRKSNHVGIFVGNGEFIHASTGSRRVKIDKLDRPYWRKHFVKFGTYMNS
jgi:cell wall-associated NlpC family hydrolase